MNNELLTIPMSPIFFLDLFASLFGILTTWYALKNSVKAYPLGLISIFTYIYILYVSGIYGDIVINLYYAIMSVYGWMLWAKKDKTQHDLVRITAFNRNQWLKTILAFFLLWFAFYVWLDQYTDSTIPYIDALTSSLGILGMYWMTQRKLDYWLFFILMDIICIFVYAHKDLYFSAAQFFVLSILAAGGYWNWYKILYKKQ